MSTGLSNFPPPVDNRIEVTLPFLMKYREHESIGGFIYNYLVSHQDISHGIFSTGPVEVVFSCSTVDEIHQMVAESPIPERSEMPASSHKRLACPL